MNWFKRHLNWTLVLSWIAPYIIFLSAMYVLHLAESFVPGEAVAIIAPLLYIACSVIPLLTGIFVLKQKGQSLWWLLFIIAALTLENRRVLTPEQR